MNKTTIFIFIAIIGIVSGAFAYMQTTYVSKDVMDIVVSGLHRIEVKVDMILQRETQRK